VKDDGLCHPAYGGNKVRKLEFLLHGAEEKVVTFGAVGSHHVLATAVHGSALGKEVHAVQMPRPWGPHAEAILQATLLKATLHFEENIIAAEEKFRALGEGSTVIAAGGSSPLGTLGFVLAAEELVSQIKEGLLPEPRKLFVALGTAGTAVGLALGLKAAGLATEVVGVRVVPSSWLTVEKIHRLMDQTAELSGLPSAELSIDDGFLGAGYGEATNVAREAVFKAGFYGEMTLEGTYTGKALASALAEESDGPHLFWQTHSNASLTPLLDGATPIVPSQWGW